MQQDFDILFVGAGPASLAGALQLKRLIKNDPKFNKLTVAVIEKAPNVGDHCLSGASLDPRALSELIPDFEAHLAKLGTKVKRESLSYLTSRFRIPYPVVPPPMSNHGCYLVSVCEFTRWLAGLCEKEGVEIYTAEPADDIVTDENGAVKGVVVKEKGLERDGKKKSNYLEPTSVMAKVTVLGEGARGSLTKKLIKRFGLDEGCTPQGYAVGIKEIWEVKKENFRAGQLSHTMGYPLGLSTFGGSFIYHIRDNQVALGLVTSLDYKDPRLNPFDLFQRWKTHPHVSRILNGGKLVAYGAKTLAEGGLYCVPRSYGDGFIIIGEGAGLLNSFRLKGIHLAMKSGMLAAETIFDALAKNNFSAGSLAAYEKKLNESWIKKELWGARNFHQGFHGGFLFGMIHTAFQMVTGGRGIIDRFKVEEDWRAMHRLSGGGETTGFTPDGKTSFDKLSCVFASGTKHEEDQPCHLRIDDISICNGRCAEEYGNPCQHFCPANVYEMVEGEDGKKVLQLNPTNCVHCKTCDIKDPYNIVTWTPPEGGGGPNYKGM